MTRRGPSPTQACGIDATKNAVMARINKCIQGPPKVSVQKIVFSAQPYTFCSHKKLIYLWFQGTEKRKLQTNVLINKVLCNFSLKCSCDQCTKLQYVSVDPNFILRVRPIIIYYQWVLAARALRAPVFLGSSPRQTGRCAPRRPSQLRCFFLCIPKIKYST